MTTVTSPIYLDHAATTPTDPDVVDAMLPFLTGESAFGNASSIHSFGRQARSAVDEARDSVARLIGADYSELYFTGSGTEADNLALIGFMQSAPPDRNHLVTTAIEHHAILHTAHYLQSQGVEITIVSPNREGLISPDAIAEAITDRTALVSVMHANNEIGTVQPIAEIARIAHARGAKFHTDAVQSAGLLPIDFRALNLDLLSLSAHKIYGPKGVGALAIRQGLKIAPLIHGGAQEREKRAGTENVAAIVGFGRAAELTLQRRDSDAERLTMLRDGFIAALRSAVPALHLNGHNREEGRGKREESKAVPALCLNGHPTLRLPNNVNVSVEGADGPTLLMNLDRRGIAASSGSACSSGSIEPSHVLKAIGLPDSLASSGIRFTLGRGTTAEELKRAAEIFGQIVKSRV